MEPYKIDFESIPWESTAPGIRFRAYRQGGKQVRLVEFTREFVEPDWCPKAHIGYVLEGMLEINFAGRLVLFRPGDGLLVPGGEESKHKVRALMEVTRLLLVEDI